MNRKLKKLLNNPRQFFLDSKVLQPAIRRFNLLQDPEENQLDSVEKAEEVVDLGITLPGLEPFDLVGKNWLEADSQKPIAILWGFHPWKRAFVSQYLAEYRTAYARGRSLWATQKSALAKHEGLRFIVWGMNDSPEVTAYSEEHGVPLYRMEDGFIRSAELGSRHTTAMSLVLDKTGIYFDASRPSQLEQILNEHAFDSNPQLMRAAEALLQVIRGLRVSKYNVGNLVAPATILGPWLKRRILVVGQVEDDASIRYGLAEGWTALKLVELAKAENPGADVIYKPHPDVVQGFRTNSATVLQLQQLCRVLTEEVVLADLFKVVDHVYTITSLSGFEALIHGLSVTTVGAPFYAGWGLTNDRIDIPRRKRRLTLQELFCGTYLLYPRYLPDLNDPVRGCLAAALRVSAQRRQNMNVQISPKFVDKRAAWLAGSDYWPVLLRPEYQPELEKKFGKKLLSLFSLQRVFAECSGDHYQRSMAYLLAGKLRGSASYGRMLGEFRLQIRPEHFAALLTDLWAMKPAAALLDHWAWYCESIGDMGKAKETLDHLAFKGTYAADPTSRLPIPLSKYGYILKLAQFELRQRNLDEAARLFNHLLLSGHSMGDVIAGLAEIARLRFDFASAAALWKFFNRYDPAWRVAKGPLLGAQAMSLAGDAEGALEAMGFACMANPQSVESAGSISDVLERDIGDLPYMDALLAANEVVDTNNPIGHAKSLITGGLPQNAERLLLDYTPAAAETLKYCLMLSLAYSYQGKLEQAKRLVCNMLPTYPVALLYREGLRLAVVRNDYDWGRKLLAEAAAREIDVGDIYHRKIALGVGDIKGSYLSFRDMKATQILRSYLGARYIQSLDPAVVNGAEHVAVVACFGPGDEIRFASLYRQMRARCGDSRVSFTCDPRLHPLLQRSCEELDFVPVARIRSLARLPNFDALSKIPGSDLHTFFDNAGWELAESADKIILSTDALGDVIDDYSSFRGTAYLAPDPLQTAAWRQRLAGVADKPLVGLSWRSSLTTYARNEHYLTVEELLPLFELENVQFVNLQYDECSAELRYLEERFPGRVIHFDDLDQFNDLDGVSALMSCLDLVIAPATTVVELAGALGRPTLFLSNSSELHWRKIPGTLTDVWHNSIQHVEGAVLGNKASLAEATRDAIASHLSARSEVKDRQPAAHGESVSTQREHTVLAAQS